jgi:hypothetical protein
LTLIWDAAKWNNMFKPKQFLPLLVLLFGCGKTGPIPKPPQWLNALPESPDWWSNTKSSYDESASLSNKWTQIRLAEAKISDLVKTGESAVQERRELLKVIDSFCKSPSLPANSHRTLVISAAGIYERLGDYRRSAKKYADVAGENNSGMGFLTLQGLASQYERLGEREAALQIYRYIGNNPSFDDIARDIGNTGIACLTGMTNNCVLKKPLWWNQYQKPPEWWGEVAVAPPSFTCFEDGYEFIIRIKEKDPRKRVKAVESLSKFTPKTFNEEIRILASLSHAYSEIADHHRAIVSAWAIPERYSCDILNSKSALTLIAAEFEKLGEMDNAKEIRNLIPCFVYPGKLHPVSQDNP